MKKLYKTLIPATCAAVALTLLFAGCAGRDEYNAKDLSDAGVDALAYEGSFTLTKTETEVYSFNDDGFTEKSSSSYGLTESYDAEGGNDVRLETTEISDYMLEKAMGEDETDTEEYTSSFAEERAYFVPYAAGSAYGTRYLYTLTDEMDEAMTSASDAQAETRRLSGDLETFGIRFSEFTFREMYTGYLEDILINFLDVEEEDVFSDISVSESGKKADKASYYEFTSAGTYRGEYNGEALITLSFTVEGGLLMRINFNLYQERVTADGDSPFAETLEYSSRCDVTYSYDSVLMLTEREKEGYYSG